jgi:hypothetical protein
MLRSVSVHVPVSNPMLYPRMITKFTFSFGLPKDMVRLLAVIMDKPGPPVPDGLLLFTYLRVIIIYKDQCVQFIVPTKCTILFTYEC